MEQLNWSDDYNTGVQVIDRQHRRIVDYINRLSGVQGAAGLQEEVRSIFDDLVDYTLTHFAFEESLLASGNSRSLHAHKKTHEMFAEKVHMLRSHLGSPKAPGAELNRLLVTWLVDHIQQEDVRDIRPVALRSGLVS